MTNKINQKILVFIPIPILPKQPLSLWRSHAVLSKNILPVENVSH